MRSRHPLLLLVLLGLASGCSSTAAAALPAATVWDRPVPDSVPRAELALAVDLEPAADCEERFDLQLYRERRVDLIRWDARRGECTNREVVIRYLSEEIRPDEVEAMVQKIARKVEKVAREATSEGMTQ